MRSILLSLVLLTAHFTSPLHAGDLVKEPIILADTSGIVYSLHSLTLCNEKYYVMDALLAESGYEGDITCSFLFKLCVDRIICRTDSGEPVYDSAITENYGCVVSIGETDLIFTGEILQQRDPDDDGYTQVYGEISYHVPLENYFGAGNLLALLGYTK